ncbi:MAG TPA: bL35 family ribosomal protein, partial [Chloroflexota bacterium]|nr:bL35 family ribosomal protein [Chloroflexota bacterium]
MPKQKTHKAIAKRFKITGSGRVLRPKGFGNKK